MASNSCKFATSLKRRYKVVLTTWYQSATARAMRVVAQKIRSSWFRRENGQGGIRSNRKSRFEHAPPHWPTGTPPLYRSLTYSMRVLRRGKHNIQRDAIAIVIA